jgi:hypothetical protein
MQLMKAMSEEEKSTMQAEQKAKMAAERQANQKRLLLVKHRMEEELDRMRVLGDFKGLQKLTGAKPGGDGEGKAEGQ